MTAITIESNARELSRTMKFFADQLPFVQAKTVNRLAFEARDQIREGVGRRFEIRKPWVARGIQIPRGGFATKQKPEAIIEVEPRRGFLFKFEEGGRVVAPLGRPFAIPAEGQQHPRRLYPTNLGFSRRHAIEGGTAEAPAVHTTRKGTRQFKGKRRTFMLHPDHHRGVVRQQILQRKGKGGRGHLEWLWRLYDVATFPAILRFHETAESVVVERFDEFFDQEFDKAIRSAR